MPTNWSNLYSHVSDPVVPPGAEERILARLEQAQARQVTHQVLAWLAGCFVSGTALIASAIWLGPQLIRSPFWSLLSLTFSDISTVAAQWQNYLWSILETIPLLPVIACLLPLFTFLLFMRLAIVAKTHLTKLHHTYELQ